ncbi:MAG: hypothetical protein IPG72_07215 [Ardenticatenales bacterium]|nr:hypothetical protein [Ardenticatenales bacterium]
MNITTDAFLPGQDIWGIDVTNLEQQPERSDLTARGAGALKPLGEYMPVSRFASARVSVCRARSSARTRWCEQVNSEWANHWYDEDDGMIVKGDFAHRIAFNSSPPTWQGEAPPYKAGYEVVGKAADGGRGGMRNCGR